MNKETVYLETTVVSYLTARLSRDVVVVAHQQITEEWWQTRVHAYDVFVSELVIQEAAQGDPRAVEKRLEAIRHFSILEITAEAEALAAKYLRRIPILRKAVRDALHLAIAVSSGMDYLVTWNCAHIARAEVRRALEGINDEDSIATPTICTPEELLGG